MKANVMIINNVLTIQLEKVIEINFEEIKTINISGKIEGDLYKEIVNIDISDQEVFSKEVKNYLFNKGNLMIISDPPMYAPDIKEEDRLYYSQFPDDYFLFRGNTNIAEKVHLEALPIDIINDLIYSKKRLLNTLMEIKKKYKKK